MNSTASSARSRSASANTMTGFLPPSSKCTRFSVAAPCAMMARAGRAFADEADRLDVGMLGQRLAGLLAEAVHDVDDARRQARLRAQISDSSIAVSGLHSAGLCTTVQPAASAGAIFQVESMNGVFHGVMTPTGPIGWRIV